MRAVIALLALLLAGCASQPPTPTENDFDEIMQQRLDSVWVQSGLDGSLRPDVTVGEPTSQLTAASTFSGCMEQRGWPGYFAAANGYRYQAIQLASTDAEKLDWYECFAASPVDSEYTLASEAQFDLVYDYYQDSLIPCLRENGQTIDDAPTRLEFRTTWVGWSDPLFPFLWNPYYPLQKHGAVDTTELEQRCAPEPPGQDFYAFGS